MRISLDYRIHSHFDCGIVGAQGDARIIGGLVYWQIELQKFEHNNAGRFIFSYLLAIPVSSKLSSHSLSLSLYFSTSVSLSLPLSILCMLAIVSGILCLWMCVDLVKTCVGRYVCGYQKTPTLPATSWFGGVGGVAEGESSTIRSRFAPQLQTEAQQ